MSDSAAASSIPEDWRHLAREVSSQEAVPTETLLRELAAYPAGVEYDFSEGWEQLVAALADSLERLAHTPALAAAFLRAEWDEFALLAETMDGEPPPEEVAERFRLAMEAASHSAGVRHVAGALRAASRAIRERGDLSPLQELEWPAAPEPEPEPVPEPVSLPAPDPTPAPPARSQPAARAPVEPVPPQPEFSPSSYAEPLPPEPVEAAPAAESLALLLLAEPALRRQFLERQLAFAGFYVETADNSREAVQRLSHGRYHAVLVEPDLVFPDLASWAEHAGATRVLHLQPGGAFGGAVRDRNVFATPPSEEEIERLRRSL